MTKRPVKRKPARTTLEAIGAGRARARSKVLEEHPFGEQAGSRLHIAQLIDRLSDESRSLEERQEEHLKIGWVPQRVPAEVQLVPLLQAYVGTLPNIPEFVAWYRDRFVPAFNKLSGDDRLCVECATRFGRVDGRGDDAKFCSDDCSNRARKRGRERVGNGRSAAENALKKAGAAAGRHMNSCAKCAEGPMCPTGERLFVAASTPGDALNRLTVPLDDE